MSNDPVKPLASLLQGPALAAIETTLARHRQVLQIVRQALPDFLARHCLDCVVKPNSLILYTDTPLFSSQLRFYATHLRQRLASEAQLHFAGIQVRNRLESGRPARPKREPPAPSSAVVDLLRAQAETDPDSELGIAFRRLSDTLARKNDRLHKPEYP